jgi:hypothetical protein
LYSANKKTLDQHISDIKKTTAIYKNIYPEKSIEMHIKKAAKRPLLKEQNPHFLLSSFHGRERFDINVRQLQWNKNATSSFQEKRIFYI